MVNLHNLQLFRGGFHTEETLGQTEMMWLWCVRHINVSIFQIPLHGVQRLSAVLPDGASTPAARALRPPGPFPHAGGAKSGGSCRPGPQLEGGAHDASDPHNAHISLS